MVYIWKQVTLVYGVALALAIAFMGVLQQIGIHVAF